MKNRIVAEVLDLQKELRAEQIEVQQLLLRLQAAEVISISSRDDKDYYIILLHNISSITLYII